MPNPGILITILVAVVATQPSFSSGSSSSHPGGIPVIQSPNATSRRLKEVHTDIPSLLVRKSPSKRRFQQKRTEPPTDTLLKTDVVFALASTQANEEVVFAGRRARVGAQTYVSVDSQLPPVEAQERLESYNETWRFQADVFQLQGGQYKANTRFAMLPFLAFQDLGDTFKWMLLGEDSTVWFMDAILEFAEGLDYNMPYIITDNLLFSKQYQGGWHPNPDAFRCAPCGYRPREFYLPLRMPRGCPCTPEVMCQRKVAFNGMLGPKSCTLPRPPVLAYGVHGGGGLLVSVGLLRSVSLQSMEQCLRNSWDYGGSTFFSKCLWEEGLGVTDPDPLWAKEHGTTLFDPSPAGVNADENVVQKAAHLMASLLRRSAGVCTGACELEGSRVMTLHLRITNELKSPWAAAALMRAMLRLPLDSQADALAEQPPSALILSRNTTLVAAVLDGKVDALLAGYMELVASLGKAHQVGQGNLPDSKVEALMSDVVLQLARNAVEEILELAVANVPYIPSPPRLRQPYRRARPAS